MAYLPSNHDRPPGYMQQSWPIEVGLKLIISYELDESYYKRLFLRWMPLPFVNLTLKLLILTITYLPW